MNDITITTRQSAALDEWQEKERGSYEDHRMSDEHVYAILRRFGKGKVTLTHEEAMIVLKSGEYHATAWEDDEIEGGAITKRTIANLCKKIEVELAKNPSPKYSQGDWLAVGYGIMADLLVVGTTNPALTLEPAITREEAEANAKIMAAGPKLLRALVELVDFIEQYGIRDSQGRSLLGDLDGLQLQYEAIKAAE